ncbi:MAG: 23S rRNA (uracil(1939)-C(5))-methyltransferase RlmD [Bdellovibrionales bacterium]|nr:23S rRNA (uracil(1939)-C(5))-methyltransferase RlmD [Bdellovibrionales bacterium]
MANEDLCPNKKLCGSCKWSHIPYSNQLEQKLSDINGSFKLHGLEITCSDITPAPKTSHYRNRMDFAIDFQGKVGLREKGKWWRVLDGHCCFISDEKIEELFHKVREWTTSAGLTFFDRKAHTGLLRYAVIRSTALGETLLSIITSEPTDDDESNKVREALDTLANMAPDTHLVWSIAHTISDVSRGETIVPIHHEPYVLEEISNYRYYIHPFTFFQTNSSGARELLNVAQSYCSDISGKRFVDLYCGSGFFTIPLSEKFQETIGVEIEAEAIERAQENAKLNKREIAFHTSKTEEFDWTTLQADLVLIDPPRAGLHDSVIEEFKKAPVETVLYVSCNYKALARELKLLAGVYEVEKMQAIDMFPHTPHVEVVSLLRRQ